MRLSDADVETLRAIVARHGAEPTELVQILREVQSRFRHIPRSAMDLLAAELSVPVGQIQGVAEFYAFFSTSPRGHYDIRISNCVTDQLRGIRGLSSYFFDSLGIKAGIIRSDGLVSADYTGCTGMCDLGPSLLVNGLPVTHLSRRRIDDICGLIESRVPVERWPREFFKTDTHLGRKDILLDHGLAPGEGLRAALARAGAEAGALARAADIMLEEITLSDLRGRGGAAFNTGIKWGECRKAVGERHYVVCNADEGEPGTFKDRILLTHCPDLVIEGMTLAGLILGAKQGFIYLRGEYQYLYEPLQEVLRRRREAGLLGDGILGQAGFDFDVRIHLGAGGYVCGEASALLESLEGKRGIPRTRPPRLAAKGYLLQPTIVNNVETYASAALVAVHGGHWYRHIGVEKAAGTKLISVSGDCERPGVYEFPFGVAVREILEAAGAVDTQAIQVSGPSGLCIDASEFDRRITFDDLSCGGAFIIFNRSRDMFEIARQFSHFFADESCGFCTPCRVGTSILKKTMDTIHEGYGRCEDLDVILRVDQVLKHASHCGLGDSAANSLVDTLKKFRHTYDQKLTVDFCDITLNLNRAVATARGLAGNPQAQRLESEEAES